MQAWSSLQGMGWLYRHHWFSRVKKTDARPFKSLNFVVSVQKNGTNHDNQEKIPLTARAKYLHLLMFCCVNVLELNS